MHELLSSCSMLIQKQDCRRYRESSNYPVPHWSGRTSLLGGGGSQHPQGGGQTPPRGRIIHLGGEGGILCRASAGHDVDDNHTDVFPTTEVFPTRRPLGNDHLPGGGRCCDPPPPRSGVRLLCRAGVAYGYAPPGRSPALAVHLGTIIWGGVMTPPGG